MRQNDYCGLGAGYLSLENFTKFIDLNPQVTEINLAHMGEAFLNPQLKEILQLAHQRGITGNFWDVNFNQVSDEVLEALVTCGTRHIKISIDGASQKAYAWYRRGGDLSAVVTNIKKLNEYKQKHESMFPVLHWQYIILQSTDSETEIKLAKQMTKELGMEPDILFVKDHAGYVPKDLEMIERETGLSYSDETWNSDNQSRYLRCFDLWRSPRINWDGRFLGCCGSSDSQEYPFNCFEMSLKEIYKQDLVVNTRTMLMGGAEILESPCYWCNVFQVLRSQKNFITADELAKNM